MMFLNFGVYQKNKLMIHNSPDRKCKRRFFTSNLKRVFWGVRL